MIIEVKMFTVQCDNCKKFSGQDSDYSCWNDESTAWDDASESGWIEDEGKHYCPNCYTIDSIDNIIIKPIKIK